MRYIIGIGDSFTHGVGAYDDDINIKYGWNVDPYRRQPDAIENMLQNAWVNQLATQLDAEPINLGQEGTGNRSAIKRLYRDPMPNFKQSDEVIVIFLATGLERFDFAAAGANEYTYTMWPNPWERWNKKKDLWKVYAKDIYSEKFALVEFYWNLMEAHTYCKAHKFKFYWSHAFDIRNNPEYFNVPELPEHFANNMLWDRYIKFQGFRTVIEMLCNLEGQYDLWTGGYWDYFRQYKKGSKYISRCCHPTKLGHKIIADEMYKHIKADLNV